MLAIVCVSVLVFIVPSIVMCHGSVGLLFSGTKGMGKIQTDGDIKCR